MDQVIDFMNSGIGRAARIVLGLALVAWGLSIGGVTGVVLVVVGIVPITLGAIGRCSVELLRRSSSRRA